MGNSKLGAKCLILASFLIVLVIGGVAGAQLGEVAGSMNFNVPVGSSQSLPFTIVNGGSAPISYYVITTVTTTIPNETAPNVTASPLNGTLGAHVQLPINITVRVPSSDKKNMTWNLVVQAVEGSSVTAPGGGAVIHLGVVKFATIESAPSLFNPLPYIIIAIIIVVVAAALAYYAFMKRKAPARHGTESRVAGLRALNKTVGKGRSRHAPARKKTKKSTKRRKGATRKTAARRNSRKPAKRNTGKSRKKA